MSRRRFLPRPFFDFPSHLSGFWDEEDQELGATYPSGLSIFEEGEHIIVEASLPGVPPDEVDVTFEGGILCIHGQKKEEKEDKHKKYYRKASSAFSYRLSIPGNIDESVEPEATFSHGVMAIKFKKKPGKGPKKIKVNKQ